MIRRIFQILIPCVFLFVARAEAFGWDPLTSILKKDTLKTEPKRYSYFSARYEIGRVLQTNDFVRGENLAGKPIDTFHALTLSYGVQTTGRKEWQHVLNFPYYGVSFYNANFFNSRELGYPTALYGFIGLPIKRGPRSSFGYELGFGLTYNWQPYDEYNNPFNIAIGSHRTVYGGGNLYYSYDLTPRWELKGGVEFSHFSNGATKQPNSGLNLFSPFVELKYSFHDRPELVRVMPPAYQKHSEIAVQYGIGKMQEEYRSKESEDIFALESFMMMNVSVAWLRQTTWKHKFGIGTDLTYNEEGNVKITYHEGQEPDVEKSSAFFDKTSMGIYGTYEFCIDRLSLASYLGAYALRKHDDREPPLLYQKFGAKYHFKNDMFIGILVRAHNFSVADFIEWNIGYRFKWY
ncbi:acyloxyacyl hydrolase [Mangrovibacterium diazotrophicum]|uniref:Lipid A 3-O-deacylase PagL n=1 Tax=Mangrovibacterium diazotrophicum TaxID=1261403 RepID=A0A419WBN2_9BACT|nr:acyloxyacyl hydrolase [Mangrovibacterium diazotrophicum]RKD92822.1 lipid A 3-O-deacylase PagL [Mangrovibacterium diazotrophicum]